MIETSNLFGLGGGRSLVSHKLVGCTRQFLNYRIDDIRCKISALESGGSVIRDRTRE